MSAGVVHSEGKPLLIVEIDNPTLESVELVKRAAGPMVDVVVLHRGTPYTIVTRGVMREAS